MSITVNCVCNGVISDEHIDYSNRCNEEGEEYYEITAHCLCGNKYELSEFGQKDNFESCKLELQQYINEIPEG